MPETGLSTVMLVLGSERVQPLDFLVPYRKFFPLLDLSRFLHELLKCLLRFLLILPLNILFDHLIKAFALPLRGGRNFLR